MRKKDENMRGILLDRAREIALEQGPDALNIRTLAERAGVATGTVYNNFESKDDILLAITEEYWRRTLVDLRDAIQADAFPDQLREIYVFLRNRLADSAGFWMNSLRDRQVTGRDKMTSMQNELRTAIIHRMRQDKNISPDVWNEALSEEKFAEFVLMSMMMSLRVNATGIDPLIEIVKRALRH